MAREAISALLGRATGPVNPSAIKEFIVRKEPDFDERDHGFSTFKKLIEALEKEGLAPSASRAPRGSGTSWRPDPKPGALQPGAGSSGPPR